MIKKKTGLVLTGGGAKAAYQAGAIKALAEIMPSQKSPFEIIAGTSAGAINAAAIASYAHDWNIGANRLQQKWAELTLDQVYRTDLISIIKIALGWVSRTLFGGFFLKNAQANYLLDTKPLFHTLDQFIDFKNINANIGSGDLYAISVTMVQYFSTSSITFFDGDEKIIPWKRANRFGVRTKLDSRHIMASSAIPIFFRPIEIDSKYYGDGSLRQTTPLSAAIHLGAERIISIGIRHENNSNDEMNSLVKQQLNPPSLAQISGELMTAVFLDSMDTDMERLESINQSVDMIEKQLNGTHPSALKKVDHLHLRPSRDLQSLIPASMKRFPPLMRFLFHGIGASNKQGSNLTGYLAFVPECSKPLIELGYSDTMKRKNEILKFMGLGTDKNE
jgi:NTE family protein